MNGPNLDDKAQSSSDESSKDEDKLVPGMRKIQGWMPTSPPQTLADLSSQALAESWMSDTDHLPNLTDPLFETELGFILQLQIAIHLRGSHLFQWIQAHNGLESIATRAWTDLFQKLLTNVFYEIDRVDQRSSIKTTLSYILEDYKKRVCKSPRLEHTLHRLGLTGYFNQGKIDLDNSLKLFYYWYLKDRSPNFRGILPMVFPLPITMQSRWPKLGDFRAAFYPNDSTIQQKKAEWRVSVSTQEYREENEGKSISAFTASKQKSLYEAYRDTYTSSERFMSCISVMARSQINGSYPVVLATALLALVHPFYSGKQDADRVTLRMFRVDIFWFMTRALCSFYALLDLPLACFKMAQQSIGPYPCLSERMRCALCFQTIAVNYGHWQAATLVYEEWYQKIPFASWLYEEFVLIHVVGLFWRMENLLVEIYINGILHNKCREVCWKKYFQWPIWRVKLLKLKILSACYRSISKTTATKLFRSELDIIYYLCCIYDITIEKIEKNCNGPEYDHRLQDLWKKIFHLREYNTSRHLYPFFSTMPFYAGTQFYWDKLIEDNLGTNKKMMQSFSHLDSPKPYADRLFSLVVNLLYHNRHSPCPDVIQETLNAYQKSTAGRHYRIPLLRKLLQVYKYPAVYQLKIDEESKPEEDLHSSVPFDQVSATNMTQKDIEAFSISALDARNDFVNVELDNDEKLIMYMKKRDPLMPAWIDCGLDCMRFADCL